MRKRSKTELKSLGIFVSFYSIRRVNLSKALRYHDRDIILLLVWLYYLVPSNIDNLPTYIDELLICL